MISEHGELSLVFAVQVCVFCSASGTRPSELPAEALLLRAVSWTRPPVPTELISVLILHTGSVQQEQESSPLGVCCGPCPPWVSQSLPGGRNEDPAGLGPGSRGGTWGWVEPGMGLVNPAVCCRPPTPISALGDCPRTPPVPTQDWAVFPGRMSRQAVGWLAGPSVKKGSQMCPCLADPRPLLVQAWWGPGWPASSQQPVTQEEAALGPPDR